MHRSRPGKLTRWVRRRRARNRNQLRSEAGARESSISGDQVASFSRESSVLRTNASALQSQTVTRMLVHARMLKEREKLKEREGEEEREREREPEGSRQERSNARDASELGIPSLNRLQDPAKLPLEFCS